MRRIRISAWGNSLGFRIPCGIAESYGLQAGDILELTAVDDGFLIKKPSFKEKKRRKKTFCRLFLMNQL
jgi:antitoxin component of MazEF toxin-antitoxin module